MYTSVVINVNEQFDSLYHQYSNLVLSIASRMLRARGIDPSEAQDISQQVWAEADQQLQAGGHINKAWVTLRTESRAHDYLNSARKRREVSLESLAAAENDDVSIYNADQAVLDQPIYRQIDPRLRDCVAGLVDSLPPGPRRAVELVYYAGRTPLEAAKEIGVEPATIRQQLHRGITALRQLIEAATRQEAA